MSLTSLQSFAPCASLSPSISPVSTRSSDDSSPISILHSTNEHESHIVDVEPSRVKSSRAIRFFMKTLRSFPLEISNRPCSSLEVPASSLCLSTPARIRSPPFESSPNLGCPSIPVEPPDYERANRAYRNSGVPPLSILRALPTYVDATS